MEAPQFNLTVNVGNDKYNSSRNDEVNSAFVQKFIVIKGNNMVEAVLGSWFFWQHVTTPVIIQ